MRPRHDIVLLARTTHELSIMAFVLSARLPITVWAIRTREDIFEAMCAPNLRGVVVCGLASEYVQGLCLAAEVGYIETTMREDRAQLLNRIRLLYARKRGPKKHGAPPLHLGNKAREQWQVAA